MAGVRRVGLLGGRCHCQQSNRRDCRGLIRLGAPSLSPVPSFRIHHHLLVTSTTCYTLPFSKALLFFSEGLERTTAQNVGT